MKHLQFELVSFLFYFQFAICSPTYPRLLSVIEKDPQLCVNNPVEKLVKEQCDIPDDDELSSYNELRCLMLYDTSLRLCKDMRSKNTTVIDEYVKKILHKKYDVGEFCIRKRNFTRHTLAQVPSYAENIESTLNETGLCQQLCSKDFKGNVYDACILFDYELLIHNLTDSHSKFSVLPEQSTGQHDEVMKPNYTSKVKSNSLANSASSLNREASHNSLDSPKSVVSPNGGALINSVGLPDSAPLLNNVLPNTAGLLNNTVLPNSDASPNSPVLPVSLSSTENQSNVTQKLGLPEPEPSQNSAPAVSLDDDLKKTSLLNFGDEKNVDTYSIPNIKSAVNVTSKPLVKEESQVQNGDQDNYIPDADDDEPIRQEDIQPEKSSTSYQVAPEEPIKMSEIEHTENGMPYEKESHMKPIVIYDEDESSYFPMMLSGVGIVALLYVLYVQKPRLRKMVMGVLVEGRHNGSRRRNSRGHSYKRLDTLEQAMGATSPSTTPSKIIY